MGLRNAVLAGLVAVVAAGCGGSGGGYGSGPSMGGGGGPPAPPGPSASVSVADYSFTPNAVTVKVGTTVTWTNSGTADHTVSADDASWGGGPLAGVGGGLYGMGGGAGGSYARTFSTAGTFPYHCAIHPTMTGTVTVTP